MEGRVAATDALFAWGTEHLHLLDDFKLEVDVELATRGHPFLKILRALHVVNRGTNTWTQEVVGQSFAHDDVVAPAVSKEIHAARHFAIGEQCRASHRVVPIAIELPKGKDCHESICPE